jgi:hypothetical protein
MWHAWPSACSLTTRRARWAPSAASGWPACVVTAGLGGVRRLACLGGSACICSDSPTHQVLGCPGTVQAAREAFGARGVAACLDALRPLPSVDVIVEDESPNRWGGAGPAEMTL